jgi:recombination protein RecA
MNAVHQDPARVEALEAAMAALTKQYGEGAVLRLDGSVHAEVGSPISTGSIGLDRALGVGGLPRGRMVEIYGPEASGKTTIALQAIASVQAEGGIAAIIDAEHALDPAYASALGVDLARLVVSQPDSGEQALEVAEKLVRSGAVDLIVVDSVAALVPEAEISGEMGDLQVGLQARMMSKAMRKLTSVVSRTHCCLLFINQLRAKIGGMGFGPKEVTTGGNALKYYTSVRIDIRRIGSVKDAKGDAIGNRTRVRVVKNKVAAPFRSAEFEIYFGTGVSTATELLDLGLEAGVVKRSGAWYAYGEERLGQGREKARDRLESDGDLSARLQAELIAPGEVAQA